MNPAFQPLAEAFALDLKDYLKVCEAVLDLVSRENQALTRAPDYSRFDYYQERKDLLRTLETSLNRLRTWRATWQQAHPEVRVGLTEARGLFQRVQELLMKIVVIDRENQQALLRRGLVPPQHLPRAAGQQPHFVAALYKRHRAD